MTRIFNCGIQLLYSALLFTYVTSHTCWPTMDKPLVKQWCGWLVTYPVLVSTYIIQTLIRSQIKFKNWGGKIKDTLWSEHLSHFQYAFWCHVGGKKIIPYYQEYIIEFLYVKAQNIIKLSSIEHVALDLLTFWIHQPLLNCCNAFQCAFAFPCT